MSRDKFQDLLETRDLEQPVEAGVVARSVLISARVKSSANQPVTGSLSMCLTVRRAANSGREVRMGYPGLTSAG